MATCDKCGHEVEFRRIGGFTQVYHFGGRGCVPKAAKDRRAGPFRSVGSFTDPNALCPVCGETVFYHQNSHGSRVFFDALGWPWPKHPCTDNPASQTAKIKKVKKDRKRSGRSPTFVNHATLYELVESEEIDGELLMRFANIAKPLLVRKLRISLAEFSGAGWQVSDLKQAPSFIITKDDHHVIIDFISARQRRIGRILTPRPDSVTR